MYINLAESKLSLLLLYNHSAQKMIRMNLPTSKCAVEGGRDVLYVSFNATLFALVRTSLKIHCPGTCTHAHSIHAVSKLHAAWIVSYVHVHCILTRKIVQRGIIVIIDINFTCNFLLYS